MLALSILALLGLSSPAYAGEEDEIAIKVAIVGISKYVTSGLTPIEGATEGCVAFKEHLLNEHPRGNILAACGNDAISDVFLTNYKRMLASMVPGDRMMFVFEGYGTRYEGQEEAPGLFFANTHFGERKAPFLYEISDLVYFTVQWMAKDTEVLIVLDAVHDAEYENLSADPAVIDFSLGPHTKDFEVLLDAEPKGKHLMVLSRMKPKSAEDSGVMYALIPCLSMQRDSNHDRALSVYEVVMCLNDDQDSKFTHYNITRQEVLWRPHDVKEDAREPRKSNGKLKPTLQFTGFLATSISLIATGVIYLRFAPMKQDLRDPQANYPDEDAYLRDLRIYNSAGKVITGLHVVAGGGLALTAGASLMSVKPGRIGIGFSSQF